MRARVECWLTKDCSKVQQSLSACDCFKSEGLICVGTPWKSQASRVSREVLVAMVELVVFAFGACQQVPMHDRATK